MKKHYLTTTLAFGLLAMAAACNDSTGLEHTADGGTGGGLTTGGALATGGIHGTGGIATTGGLIATGGISTTGGIASSGGTTKTGGVISSGGVTSTGGGSTCGGIAGFACPANQWCEMPSATCNTPDMMGACVSAGSGACPAIYSPVCGCDGKTYGNDCERRNAKVSKQADGACPTAVSKCGGLAGLKCPAKQWCEFADKTCGAADQMGVCLMTESGACPPVYRPVCGCDGKTYGSDCERRDAQVSKVADGACPIVDAGVLDAGATDAGTVGKRCGSIVGISCSVGEWCEFPADMCQVSDNVGACEAVPTMCTRQYLPVCGCDNRTYGNDCERRAAKVQKRSSGACSVDAGINDSGKPGTGTVGSACGGDAPTSCLPTLYCEYLAGTCGVAESSGTCKSMGSGICITLYSPVCGCDNRTYSNDCVRQFAGVALKSTGACL